MEPVDILGIDLGTTKSVIAIWEPKTEDTGQVQVLPNSEGEMVTPSAVSFDPGTGVVLVGESARARMMTAPETVVYSVKRFIGRSPDDPWVKEDQKRMTYAITEHPERGVVIHVAGRELTPPEISSEVLRKLKQDASKALGREVTRAVISVPAYFNESQRRATQRAGHRAELSVPRIIPEPTAAALAFGLGEKTETVAVYDLGGGTFDISILRIEAGLFRVKAIDGNAHLGGDDFDEAIVQWLRAEFERSHPTFGCRSTRISGSERVYEKRLSMAKIVLMDTAEHVIFLPDLATADSQPLGLEALLTRSVMERLIKPFIDETLMLVDRALQTGLVTARRPQPDLVGRRADAHHHQGGASSAPQSSDQRQCAARGNGRSGRGGARAHGCAATSKARLRCGTPTRFLSGSN